MDKETKFQPDLPAVRLSFQSVTEVDEKRLNQPFEEGLAGRRLLWWTLKDVLRHGEWPYPTEQTRNAATAFSYGYTCSSYEKPFLVNDYNPTKLLGATLSMETASRLTKPRSGCKKTQDLETSRDLPEYTVAELAQAASKIGYECRLRNVGPDSEQSADCQIDYSITTVVRPTRVGRNNGATWQEKTFISNHSLEIKIQPDKQISFWHTIHSSEER